MAVVVPVVVGLVVAPGRVGWWFGCRFLVLIGMLMPWTHLYSTGTVQYWYIPGTGRFRSSTFPVKRCAPRWEIFPGAPRLYMVR